MQLIKTGNITLIAGSAPTPGSTSCPPPVPPTPPVPYHPPGNSGSTSQCMVVFIYGPKIDGRDNVIGQTEVCT